MEDEEDIIECEYCSVEIGPTDELIEHDGHDFCGECCMEVWIEQNEEDEEEE